MDYPSPVPPHHGAPPPSPTAPQGAGYPPPQYGAPPVYPPQHQYHTIGSSAYYRQFPPHLYAQPQHYPYAVASPPTTPPQSPSAEPKEVTVVKKGMLYINQDSGWQKRFCTVSNDLKLCFFANEKQSKPLLVIQMNPARTEITLPDNHIRLVHDNGTLLINAINAVALKEWLAVLVALLKDHGAGAAAASPTFVPGAASSPMITRTPPSPRSHANAGGSLPSSDQQPASSPSNIEPKRSASGRALKTKEMTRTASTGALGSNKKIVKHSRQASQEKPRTRSSSDRPAGVRKSSEQSLSTSAPESATSPQEPDYDAEPKPLSPSASSTSSDGPSEAETLRKELLELQAKNRDLERQLTEFKLAARAALGGPQESKARSFSENDLPKPLSATERNISKMQPVTISLQTDHIEYHERLGGGGSGAQVFRCTIKGFSFAAKILDTTHQAQEDIDPLVKEIMIMTGLEHDNIVRYLGSDLRPGKKDIRLFMELYSGTLRNVIDARIERGKRFTRREIVDYCFQIAKGLYYLHKQDPIIVHRDLKSDNIFVSWDGQKNPQNLRIGDFDVSKILGTGKIAFTQNVGTPGFIAPEVYSKSEDRTLNDGHGPEADIWSFGMILFELITLRRPYYDLNYFQMAECNARGERPTLPDDIDKEEFKDLLKLLNKCTNKNPAKRPSAKKLVSILGKL